MMTKEYLQKLYGDNAKVEVCEECEQGSLEIIISRTKDTFQINLADYATAAAMLAIAKEKGLTENLKGTGDTVSLMTRCVCFQVTDPGGTRTECFLCQEPPDIHCAGPFPYCPSDKSIFKIIDDGSRQYVSVQNVHLPNETCNQGWAVMMNSTFISGAPERKIRVFYNFNNRPMVVDTHPFHPQPFPNDNRYDLLACWGGNYVITGSEYM